MVLRLPALIPIWLASSLLFVAAHAALASPGQSNERAPDPGSLPAASPFVDFGCWVPGLTIPPGSTAINTTLVLCSNSVFSLPVYASRSIAFDSDSDWEKVQAHCAHWLESVGFEKLESHSVELTYDVFSPTTDLDNVEARWSSPFSSLQVQLLNLREYRYHYIAGYLFPQDSPQFELTVETIP